MTNAPRSSQSDVYRHPRYYALGYRWNTEAECDFLEACLASYYDGKATRVLDIGCGSGRHLFELARRGYQPTGIDLSEEMVAYVNDQAQRQRLPVQVAVGDLRRITVDGSFELAVCLMDTFRFLLSNDEIIRHLQEVGRRLVPGGLYITDFWVPMQWDQIANDVHQWEQTEGDTTVRVFYVQDPDSVDPVQQTFEDELVFVVDEQGSSREIHGGRTRTRLLLPQEFRLVVRASGMFEVVDTFADFDRSKPYDGSFQSWRMISVLKRCA